MKKKTYIAPSIEIQIMEAIDTILFESSWRADDNDPIKIVQGDPDDGIRFSKDGNWGNLWNDDFEDEEDY